MKTKNQLSEKMLFVVYGVVMVLIVVTLSSFGLLEK